MKRDKRALERPAAPGESAGGRDSGHKGPMPRFAALAVVAGLAGILAGPAAADWRHDLKFLRVGFLAGSSPAADLARLEPFRAYLADKLGVPVDLLPFPTYDSLIDAEVSDRVNYAINSATSYATAEARCDCLDPVAAPTAFDGSRGFYAVLLVRADSPIRSLADVRGTRVAFSAPDSIAGRLVPMRALAAAGIDPATGFAATLTESGPEAAVAALLSGEADVAVAWSSLRGDPASGYSFGVLTRLVAGKRLSMDKVRILWQSGVIPFGPHALRRDAPPEVKPIVMEALAALAVESPDVLAAVDPTSFGGGGFVPAAAGDYAIIADLIVPPPAN